MENKSNNNSPTSIIHEVNLIADHIKTSSKSKFQSISLILLTYHLLLVYTFPNSLKSAKVIPIHKKTQNGLCLIIYQYLFFPTWTKLWRN